MSVLLLIEQHQQHIRALCLKHGVQRLELFGSAAREDFDLTESDLDFFVEFADSGWRGSFKRFMGLKLGLEDVLGKSVDLIELAFVKNPYFLQVASRHTQLLYAA